MTDAQLSKAFALMRGESPALSESDAREISHFAQTQGIEGLLYRDGYGLQWFALTDAIRRRNLVVNKVAADITRMLEADGFHTCVLKGQGNAQLYDEPLRRSSGDVDIWVCGKDGQYPGRREMKRLVIDWAKARYEISHAIYYHTTFTHDSVKVETHYTASRLYTPWRNWRFQRWLRSCAPIMAANRISLPDGVGEISVPTREFNLIYVLEHIYRHLFESGITFKQFMDYWHLLRMQPALTAEERARVTTLLKRFGLYRFACAVMWFMREYMHASDEQLIVPVDEKRGKHLLRIILQRSSMALYGKPFENIMQMPFWRKNWTRLKRNVMMIRYYPEEAICEPLTRLFRRIEE